MLVESPAHAQIASRFDGAALHAHPAADRLDHEDHRNDDRERGEEVGHGSMLGVGPTGVHGAVIQS